MINVDEIFSVDGKIVCPKCGKPTRVGHEMSEDGKKQRVCKHKDCKKTF